MNFPPGRTQRTHSATCRRRKKRCSRFEFATTASNAPSPNGSGSVSRSTCCASTPRARVRSGPTRETSVPTTSTPCSFEHPGEKPGAATGVEHVLARLECVEHELEPRVVHASLRARVASGRRSTSEDPLFETRSVPPGGAPDRGSSPARRKVESARRAPAATFPGRCSASHGHPHGPACRASSAGSARCASMHASTRPGWRPRGWNARARRNHSSHGRWESRAARRSGRRPPGSGPAPRAACPRRRRRRRSRDRVPGRPAWPAAHRRSWRRRRRGRAPRPRPVRHGQHDERRGGRRRARRTDRPRHG